jgi:hypothetical protein
LQPQNAFAAIVVSLEFDAKVTEKSELQPSKCSDWMISIDSGTQIDLRAFGLGAPETTNASPPQRTTRGSVSWAKLATLIANPLTQTRQRGQSLRVAAILRTVNLPAS